MVLAVPLLSSSFIDKFDATGAPDGLRPLRCDRLIFRLLRLATLGVLGSGGGEIGPLLPHSKKQLSVDLCLDSVALQNAIKAAQSL